MGEVPAARDFDSIARTLLSNAQSDGGDAYILVRHADGVKNSALAKRSKKKTSRTMRNPAPLAEARRALRGQFVQDAIQGYCKNGMPATAKSRLSQVKQFCLRRGFSRGRPCNRLIIGPSQRI